MNLEFDEHGYLTNYSEPLYADRDMVKYHFSRSSLKRWELWSFIEEFLEILAYYSLPVLDVWVDGSFISQNNTPNDVDIVVFVKADYLEGNRTSFDSLDAAYKCFGCQVGADTR